MAVTIKKIAQVSGVSRGTVDRVLNNRGKVSREAEELVRRTAAELGYTPNQAGKALAARKKKFVVGIILCSEGIEFYDEVLSGIEKAEREASEYGVKVCLKTMKGYDIKRQLALVESMEGSVNCLILNAINDEEIAEKINALYEKGIFVVTINTDVENSRRICFVGPDFIKSGETACGMIGLLTGGQAHVGLATGSVKILGHNQRLTGFRNICKSKYPELKVVDIIETEDDDATAYERTARMLAEHPEIEAIYIAAAGPAGVCRAVEESGRELVLVANDCTPTIRRLIQSGEVKASICQQPFTQGYQSLTIAVRTLVSGTLPEKDNYIVENEIRICENLL